MQLTVAPCQLRHPPKPNYAGSSTGHLVIVTSLDPKAAASFVADELKRELRPHTLDRQVIVLRFCLQEGQRLSFAHEKACLDTLIDHGSYSGNQALVWHSCIESQRKPPLTIVRPGLFYPWDSEWAKRIPISALSLDNVTKPRRREAVTT